MKDHLELILGIVGLAGIIYKIAKVEEKIFDTIQEMRKDFTVHLAEYEVRREWVDYMLHALNEKIGHKFERLREEMRTRREDNWK